ncbi:MAG: adenylate/guanylate cyclase domain-containing protein [Ignavibacteriae bacterium]|nr:adenylate/guanylate cyclase domain-containing protein [Ignavibacteriota bacterium]
MYLKHNLLTLTDKESFIHGEKVNVAVVYADLRGFAQWSLTSTPSQITRVIEVVYDRVIQLAFFYKHTFHKFLGDGFVLIWEEKDHGTLADALHWALAAAFEIHKRYWYIAERLQFPSPLGFGIGIACGEVVRIDPETFIPELNDPDFVGYPMNCGARLQKLAGPYGTVLDSRGVDIAMKNPERVLRTTNEILRLELFKPHNKAISMAHTFTGLQEDDIFGFCYVTWPYVKNSLWNVDGRV